MFSLKKSIDQGIIWQNISRSVEVEPLPTLKKDCDISMESFITVHYETIGITFF